MHNYTYFQKLLIFLLFGCCLGFYNSRAQSIVYLPNNSFADTNRTDLTSNLGKPNFLISSDRYKANKPMNTPLRGALYGFAIGGTGGVILGLTGKDWVLANGKVVSRPVHAVVDMFIVATPLTLMGLVVGARQDKTTLEPSRWHLGLGGGWASVMAYSNIKNAFDMSGIPNHIPHWFGYLHYPNGENSSTPYTWNLTVDYNFTRKYGFGVSFNNFVNQQIRGGINHRQPGPQQESARGETYSFLGNYIINPITPENKTRLEFSVGAGPSFHNLLVAGNMGTREYQTRKRTLTAHYRAAVDYYSRKNLSLQLKAGYRPKQQVRVPQQVDGATNLIAHSVNFRSLDITIGIRYHLKTL